ncbi:MAG: STAS domain-containing protein [Actinomycetota bacterium]
MQPMQPDPSYASSDGAHPLSITVGQQDGHLLLVLQGSADLESKEQLLQSLRDAIDQSGSVVLDLRDLEFMDSSGLSALVIAANRAQRFGETITVRHPRNIVRQMIQMSGVDGVVKVELDGTG